ncbi:MAG: low molecular weight protein-tyrosine-phosphatase [Rhodanobacter sp.]
MIQRVLFVCVGNLCRSPMAEGMLRHAMPMLTVASAGVHARSGMHADSMAVAVMQEHGIDISAHRSKALTGSMCARNDMLLVMDRRLREKIADHYPDQRGKIHVLADAGIPDPYRQSDEAFADCYARIDAAMQTWLPRLYALGASSARAVS